jgi:hypothetical protein
MSGKTPSRSFLEWQASLIPDEFGLPTCSCGNSKAFGQVAGFYMCSECPDGVHRWFGYDSCKKEWVQTKPFSD